MQDVNGCSVPDYSHWMSSVFTLDPYYITSFFAKSYCASKISVSNHEGSWNHMNWSEQRVEHLKGVEQQTIWHTQLVVEW